ncbi:unnamed protein product [Cylicocyclus nassatus]|uniref:Apple domain-containing protein n=1 Tax=Cylicocyclus nassatus TaxID=53992 RepID=A0AA36GYY3_CYLNA|nr:unnamed protein product [Cylicocyclus nassatus]
MRLLFFVLIGEGMVIYVQPMEDVFSCFLYYPSRFLERSGAYSEGRLENVSICLQRCLESKQMHNFECRSAMWKRDTHLCVLSAYDRTQRADKFRVASQNDIDMYENTCTAEKNAETMSFRSDWDLIRTTIPVAEKWVTTPRPRIRKKPKPIMEDAPLRRVREPMPLAKTFYRKRQGSGQTGSGAQEYDVALPIRKLKKFRSDLAKTFSVPTSHSELVVDAQVDGKPRTLSNLPAEPWRLPPIRNSLITRNFFANTIRKPNASPPPGNQFPRPPDLPKAHIATRELNRSPTQSDIPKKQAVPRLTAAATEKPCFTRYKRKILPGFDEKTVTGIDQNPCLMLCLHSDTFYCASVNYDELRKSCTLNGGNLHLNNAVLQPSTSDYYENECTPKTSKSKRNKIITSTPLPSTECFETLNESMLLSLDSKLMENINTLEECKSECMKFGLIRQQPCGALNWLPSSKGCMLFKAGFDLKLIVSHPTAQFLVNKCEKSDSDFDQANKEEENVSEDYTAAT